jgi:uncharacterized protein (DUF58 family)
VTEERGRDLPAGAKVPPARALDPEVAKRVANLSISAKKAVDGLLSGVHKSPHRGASVVFVEHREYRPGDDLRLLDWRAYARSDRHQIKRFEQETHLRATLVMDRSGSMAYGGGERATKAEHAATLLGALAFILIRQGDAPGLAVVGTRVDARLPPRTKPAHLEEVLRELATPPLEGTPTDLHVALTEVAERAGRRGLVAVASDLLDFDERALEPLSYLVGHGHEVVVFHVLDPDEIELPFDEPARFVGLEGEGSLDADPEALREAYALEMGAFLARCRARCTAAGARYVLARTDEPVERTLASVLISASRKGFA